MPEDPRQQIRSVAPAQVDWAVAGETNGREAAAMDPIGAFSFLGGPAMITLLARFAAPQMSDRTPGRNGSTGIKTRPTRASDEARFEGHAAAASRTRLAARTGQLFISCAALLCHATWFSAAFVATAAGHVAVATLLLLSTKAASQAARAINAGTGSTATWQAAGR